MRKLLIVFVLMFASSAFAVVGTAQGKICNVAISQATNPCAFGVAIGNNVDVFVVVRWDDSTARTLTLSTSAGATCDAPWATATAKVVNVAGGVNNQAMQSFWCHFTTGGAETVLATFSGVVPFSDVGIYEITGTNGLDKAVSAKDANTTSTGSTPCASGATAALTQTGDLAIAFCGLWNRVQTWASSGSWNIQAAPYSTTAFGIWTQTAPSTTALSLSVAIGAGADKWTSVVATFNPAGAVASTDAGVSKWDKLIKYGADE